MKSFTPNNEDLPSSLIGLVVCGGKSSRMGTDKSMLVYHGKPQCYHVYEMLLQICDRVFISGNSTQKFEDGYAIIPDLPAYQDIGPMAALLSAMKLLPGANFLLIGCDYPFLTHADVRAFLHKAENNSAAFYNLAAGVYEPLLALYSNSSALELLQAFHTGNFSLQQYLSHNNIRKFLPENIQAIRSVDTPEDYLKIVGNTL